MNDKLRIFLVLSFLLFVSGCFEGYMRTPGNLDALIDTAHNLSKANVVSAPFNPYAVPIGIGLSGIVGILEALRRREREGRKRAEQTLNGNNNHT